MAQPATVNYDGDMEGNDLVAANGTSSTGGRSRSGSMALSAVGGLTSAYAIHQSAKINRDLARFNARYQQMQAEQALQAGGFAAVRRQVVQDQLAGRERASAAGSGTVAGAGSNRLTVASQAAGSAMDQYLIRLNAGREAYARRIGAAGTKMAGDMAYQKGEMQALETLLSTGEEEWKYTDPTWNPRGDRGVPLAR